MLPPNERINAITWKCSQLGMTYGQFVNRYSEKEMQDVYREYELRLAERRQREEKWMSRSGGRKRDEHESIEK